MAKCIWCEVSVAGRRNSCCSVECRDKVACCAPDTQRESRRLGRALDAFAAANPENDNW